MELKIFSVYDVKAKAYMQPFFVQTRGLAIRMFTDLVNDEKSSVNKYPEDYTLFEIGSMDDCTALLTSLEVPDPAATAISLLQEKRTLN